MVTKIIPNNLHESPIISHQPLLLRKKNFDSHSLFLWLCACASISVSHLLKSDSECELLKSNNNFLWKRSILATTRSIFSKLGFVFWWCQWYGFNFTLNLCWLVYQKNSTKWFFKPNFHLQFLCKYCYRDLFKPHPLVQLNELCFKLVINSLLEKNAHR